MAGGIFQNFAGDALATVFVAALLAGIHGGVRFARLLHDTVREVRRLAGVVDELARKHHLGEVHGPGHRHRRAS